MLNTAYSKNSEIIMNWILWSSLHSHFLIKKKYCPSNKILKSRNRDTVRLT